MRQVIPKSIIKAKCKIKKKPKSNYKPFHGGKPFKQKHFSSEKYGTSQLERDFAKDFLDKLGLTYIYQYEAKDMKRFYDFGITAYDDVEYKTEVKDGIHCVKQEGQFFPLDLLIEVDGSYYHSDPRVVNENELSPMQKHNKFVDRLKDKWAAMHGVPLLRIWEYDIRNNPKKVIEEIDKYVKSSKKKRAIKENKKKPH